MSLNSQIPSHAVAVIPNDTTPIAGVALYIGGDGNVALRPEGSPNDAIFVGLKAGTVLPIRFTHIRATLTTATNLVRMF